MQITSINLLKEKKEQDMKFAHIFSTKNYMHSTTRVNRHMYLGSLEELIQNLRQGWVCMNSKLDVLQGTNGYVKIQAFYHYAGSTNATKLTKFISNSLAHEFQGHLMPRG
jgi:hypothetical protein